MQLMRMSSLGRLATRLLAAVSLFGGSAPTQALVDGAQRVEFDNAPYVYRASPFRIRQAKKRGISVELKTEPTVRLCAYLSRPKGDGPYPAVVLLHTCAGISKHEGFWVTRLVAQGYVVLTVDSLTPRGMSYICDGRPSSPAACLTHWMLTVRRFTCRACRTLIPIG
jgi:hypothetical protein